MQDDALQVVITSLQRALAAAEASSNQYAALKEQVLSAQSKSSELEQVHTQSAAELQACQQQCQELEQQLTNASQELANLQSALWASEQQAATAHEQLSHAQEQVHVLQHQLSSGGQEHYQQQKQLQEHIQQLQTDLAAAHSSRDLLLQQLQQQEAQLQELLDSADATKAAATDSDEELPITQYEDVSLQQQQQQQAEIQALKAQVCRLLDDSAVLQVRNESLDQQLSVSKLELTRLQQQLAAAVIQQQQMQTVGQQPSNPTQQAQEQQQQAEQQKPQQRHDEAKQSAEQQPSHQSRVLHDKAYYKRKYIEVKGRYDLLKQQRQKGCYTCQIAQPKPVQQHDSSRQASMQHQQHQEAAHAAEAPDAVQMLVTAQLAGNSPGSKAKHSSKQQKHLQTEVVDGVAAAAAAAAAVNLSSSLDPSRDLVDLTVPPCKRPRRQAAAAVGQPSPRTAAAAARLAAAMSPYNKRRKATKVPCTAPAVAPSASALQTAPPATAGGAAAAAALSCGRSVEATAAIAAVALPCSADHNKGPAQTAQPNQHTVQPQLQQQQQRPQQQDTEQCEATLPFMTGSNSTGDTVRLSQEQQQQQRITVKQEVCFSAGGVKEALQRDAAGVVGGLTVGRFIPQAVTVSTSTAKHIVMQELEVSAADPQAGFGAQQQQQQDSTGGHSPAWRAARGTKGKKGGGTAPVVDGTNNSSIRRKGSRSRSPQEVCVPLEPAAAAVAAGGMDGNAAADSDSDFDCPAPSHRQQQQQQQALQSKRPRKRAKPPGDLDLSEFDLSQEQQQQLLGVHEQQQQQQAAAASRHGGRRRGATPGLQQQEVQQQQQEEEDGGDVNEVPVAAACVVQQQAVFAVPRVVQQKQSAAQCSWSLPNAPAGGAAGRSRYTMVCSKPVVAKQHSAPAAAAAEDTPAEHPGAASTAGTAAAKTGLDPARSIENKPPATAAAAASGYKYQEVVRKKAARELLPAYECEECKKFYTALQSWGAAGQLGLPTCGHAAPSSGTATAAGGGDGSGLTAAAGVVGIGIGRQQQQQTGVQQLVQNAGRHRAKWQPPSTPPGFWHIGFTPDVDSPVARR